MAAITKGSYLYRVGRFVYHAPGFGSAASVAYRPSIGVVKGIRNILPESRLKASLRNFACGYYNPLEALDLEGNIRHGN